MCSVTESFFFHLWWTPWVQSKQSDMVQLSLSLSPLILLALPKPSNISPCQKKHGFDISAAPDICSANSGGNLKPSCPADQTECRAGCSGRSEVWLGCARSYGAWRGATNWHSMSSFSHLRLPLVLPPINNKIQLQWFRSCSWESTEVCPKVICLPPLCALSRAAAPLIEGMGKKLNAKQKQ